jgi:DnaJ-class molecular chaperone
MMVECPMCEGEGLIDMRDSDAYLSEHWSDEEIANAKACGMVHPVGIILCMECEGSGVVTEDRLKDINATAHAQVQQALAKLREQGLVD